MLHNAPNFIVLGAQKAGSTFLTAALRAHPEIFMPAEEVPAFEDPDYQQDGLEKLSRLLADAGPAKAVGFKRAALLARPECPERIARHVPAAKLLAILRNPVERAVSSLFNLMHGGKAPIVPVERGMRAILDGEWAESWPMSSIVIEYGFYHAHLQRYLQRFDRRQLIIVLYEDVKADALKVVQELYEQLGVMKDYVPKTLDQRPMATPYSLTRLRIGRLLQPTYSQLSEDGTRRYRRTGPAATAMRGFSAALDRGVLSRLLKARAPQLSPELQARLREVYREDVLALGELLGRDLSHLLIGGAAAAR